MIDWNGRIDDLAFALRTQHAVNDRLAIEALLSAMINCPRTPASWLILETNWFDRNCEEGWFSFGKTWIPASLPRLRARSPWREIEEEMEQWMENPNEEHLFIEPDYERYPLFSRLTQGIFLLQRSLRIRTRTSRAPNPLLELDNREQERQQTELANYAAAVLEDRVRTRPDNPPKFIEPPEFLYYAELVQRLSPWYSDWRVLLRSFGALAVRHAYLCGREQTGPAEAALLARVAADSIAPWIANALRALLGGPVKGAALEKAMLIEKKPRSRYGPAYELGRIRRQGIVEWDKHAMTWVLVAQHRRGVEILLNGQAFGTLASCA
jgi:hypothetical protein